MLVLISADPRTSHRAAEAVRVAAGLAAVSGRKVEACFCQAAALMLVRSPARLVEAEAIGSALPVLERHAAAVWAESGDPCLEGEPRIAFERIGLEDLVRLVRRQERVIRF